MESTLREVAIEEVSTRTVGANNSTIWDIKTAGGPTVNTFKAELGNAARIIWEQGQLADMKVTVEQKGQYTNYLLDKIQVSKNSVSTPVGQAAVQAQQAQELSFEKFAETEKLRLAHADAVQAQREMSIHRQVAAKVAATLQPGTANEFWSNVEELVTFFQTGETPFTANTSSVTSHTADPGPVDLPPLSDDDIPF
jgi:hypothetical protein